MTNAFQLNEDQQAVLDTADRFAREQMYPLSERMDNEEWWPEDIFKQMGEVGLLGATIAPEYGGAGLDFLSAGLICQAFGRWNHALALSWAAHDNLCANNIYHNGSEELKQKYLPKLCSGEHIGALGLTEPGAGSDALGSMRTTAKLEGDRYILNGRKLYITNGPVADVLLVYAKTDTSLGSKGITAFVVEKDFPGFSIGQKLTKMGYRGSQTSELIFDNCEVPAANVIGVPGQGHAVVMSGLDLERAMIAPIGVGVSERALQISIDYAQQREQFGQPIANFQMMQARIADMYTWTEASRALVYQVLEEAGQMGHGQSGRGSIHARTAASVMFAADMTNKVLDNLVQIHGGAGYIWESEANRLYRSNKLLEIGAGTSEVRKMIIAGELLK